jgi:PAS domain S-box-containing protein
MLGFSSKEEVIGKSSFDFIAKKDRQRAYESLKKTLEQGTTRNLEYTLLKKDGEESWGELSASIIKDSIGSPLGFVGIMREITERKRSEAEVARLASFPERNPNPVLETDLTGKITYLNPAARKLLSQLRDSKLSDGFEDDLKTIISEYNTHQTENFVRENVKIGDRYYQQSIHYVPENAALRIYIVDITEHKQWEDAVRDAKEKWASLTENTDDIVMIVDGNGVIQYINRTIPPYTPEETVGKTVYEYIPREQHDVFEKSLREVFKTGKPDSY